MEILSDTFSPRVLQLYCLQMREDGKVHELDGDIQDNVLSMFTHCTLLYPVCLSPPEALCPEQGSLEARTRVGCVLLVPVSLWEPEALGRVQWRGGGGVVKDSSTWKIQDSSLSSEAKVRGRPGESGRQRVGLSGRTWMGTQSPGSSLSDHVNYFG